MEERTYYYEKRLFGLYKDHWVIYCEKNNRYEDVGAVVDEDSAEKLVDELNGRPLTLTPDEFKEAVFGLELEFGEIRESVSDLNLYLEEAAEALVKFRNLRYTLIPTEGKKEG